MSVSIMPTVLSGFEAKACASNEVKVDLPTPPLPERIKTLCFMPARRAVMRGISGSGPLGAEAHIAWLGQPAQESAFPAASDSGPGQCSGSGATRVGAVLSGAERTSSTLSGASSEGAIVNYVLYSIQIESLM